MQYKNSFNLCACFMMVFILETASARRQKEICIPCSVLNKWNICGSNQTDICITDKKQLLQVLRKTVIGDQTEQVMTSKDVKDCQERFHMYTVALTVSYGLMLIMLVTLHFISHLRWRRALRNRSDNQNETTNILLKENANCDVPELSKQPSLFKKSFDATLSRPELQKLEKSMKSVGILFWNNSGQGTVIRIGSKYILTAWHVIKPIVSTPGRLDNYGNAINSMNVKALENKDKVYVDFSENTRHVEPQCCFRLLPTICFLDKNLDVCILEVDGEGRDLPKPIDVFRDFEKMNRGTTSKFVHVIGQHPGTPNIVVDPGCKIILHDDKKVKEANKLIKKHKREIKRHNDIKGDLRQPYEEVFGAKGNLVLDTYLEFGASGGAVISFTPDGEVALVGILLRGLPSWFWTKGSCERGFKSALRMEVACLITEILSSKDWRDSEKERIFGQSGQTDSSDDTGDKMETDQSETGAFVIFHSTRQDQCNADIKMETNQLEEDAVDNKMSEISLKETC